MYGSYRTTCTVVIDCGNVSCMCSNTKLQIRILGPTDTTHSAALLLAPAIKTWDHNLTSAVLLLVAPDRLLPDLCHHPGAKRRSRGDVAPQCRGLPPMVRSEAATLIHQTCQGRFRRLVAQPRCTAARVEWVSVCLQRHIHSPYPRSKRSSSVRSTVWPSVVTATSIFLHGLPSIHPAPAAFSVDIYICYLAVALALLGLARTRMWWRRVLSKQSIVGC